MRFFNLPKSLLTLSLGLASLAAIGCNGASETADQPANETVETAEITATPVNFANTKCPIMGGEPTEELTAEYKGKTIGFCCEGCPEKWAELSAEEKAEKFAEVAKESAQTDPAESDGSEPEGSETEPSDES